MFASDCQLKFQSINLCGLSAFLGIIVAHKRCIELSCFSIQICVSGSLRIYYNNNNNKTTLDFSSPIPINLFFLNEKNLFNPQEFGRHILK
ncbi:hypothetical protein BpHYR1_015491 [Brachionus plicatilis]|uniref:Uncharacterized protein n=1 Tax=Brachionus plicatilis TaxID=10195 RepID=A0A3M7T117_BRAPC|nr:hypothetical protein BpHYR1_015491 [Brachionus plicatilis]